MRSAFWFALGAGVGIYASTKARQRVGQTPPAELGQLVEQTAKGMLYSVRDFVERARAASAEREAELRDALGLPD